MIELIAVIVLAAIGLLVIRSAFNTTSTGTEKPQKQTTQAPKKAEKQQQQQPSFAAPQKKSSASPKKPALTKKQKAEKAAEEAEMDRLIAQSAQSVSGMQTDKKKVISLESVAKKEKEQSKKAEAVQISTKQRLIEAEEGFNIVEKKEKTVSQKFVKAKNKKKDEQRKDQDLSNFFKAQDKKGKNSFKRFGEDKESDEKKPSGSVQMKKKITSDAKDMWNERKYD